MTEPLNIAIAGLGTVGGGLLRLLTSRRDALALTLGREIVVTGVCARDRSKSRGVDLSGVTWFDDPVALARSKGVDIFVELIGGSDGVAKAAVEAALEAGRHVVTANKALLARHGIALSKVAEQRDVAIGFEAAVAGGIPVIKTLREALVGNEVSRVYGILNGTCNFILTKMEREGRPFGEVLAEAQALGYAEADPTFDIGGHDTAHKLALLTSLAFGTKVDFDRIALEGIASITPADIQAADQLGYRIKLLGVAQRTEHGIEQRVHDRPGVMAAIATGMAEHKVSLESIVQRRPGALAGTMPPQAPGAVTSVVLITHESVEADVRKAIDRIMSQGNVMVEQPQLIRIEQL